MTTLTAPHGADLTDWFARHVPDGSTVNIEPALPGDNFEQGVHIGGKKNVSVFFIADGGKPHIVLTTDGSGVAPPAVSGIAPGWPRKRVALGVSGAHDNVRLYGPVIQGPNPNAGLADSAYVPALEAQHGVEVMGGRGCLVKDPVVRDVYGDFFYVGGGSYNTILCGFDFNRNGRQGISGTWADGLLICGGSMDNVRRSFFDFEVPAGGQYVRNVEVHDVTLGTSRLNFASALGAGDVSDINLHDITMADAMALQCTPPAAGVRRHNWTVTNVTSKQPAGSPSGASMIFDRVDGVNVHLCHVALQPGRNMVIAKTVTCTGVSVTDNVYAQGVGQLRES